MSTNDVQMQEIVVVSRDQTLPTQFIRLQRNLSVVYKEYITQKLNAIKCMLNECIENMQGKETVCEEDVEGYMLC